MSLKTERYLKSPNAVDAFQVVNTPIFIRKNRDMTWDAYILLKPCNSEWTIVVGVRTKTEASTAVENYLKRIFAQ